MVRVGGRSKGCRLCRQRRIKCDEATPACTQCKTTGRICPGPITEIIIKDMTPIAKRTTTARRPTSGKSASLLRKVGNAKRNIAVCTQSIPHSGSLVEFDDAVPDPVEFENSVEIQTPDYNSAHSTGAVLAMEQNRDNRLSVERLGVDVDPFKTLPVGLYFSVPKLINHCTHAIGDSLIVLGSGDPMRDVWLPMIFSDQLLLQCTMYTTSVHMSAIYGMDLMSSIDVVTHRAGTLALLNQRLSDPLRAVNDITLLSVLGFLGQVIVCKNVQETTLHLNGIQKMLALNPSFQPSDNIRETLFWTDLIGSALCHTPPRLYARRPNIRLRCHPIFLNPRSTIGVLCRGFQKILTNHSVFNSITDILHDLRCLTIVLHYSDCKAHSEMIIYNDICHSVKRRLESLPSMEESRIFESARLAVMAFTELVLLNDFSNITVLAAGIKATLENADMGKAMQHTPELMIWILFIGNVAAFGTELNIWFKESFARTLSLQGLYHFETVRRGLIEFLWLEGVLNQQLKAIWTEVETRIES